MLTEKEEQILNHLKIYYDMTFLYVHNNINSFTFNKVFIFETN